ncbi:hypothetical protein [Oryzihumus leptocrescens]|uniref:Uncharacterized protein n=1 Tax=Oryzihumus leptocrescens TaxID=297536 RepID=A0A542ZLH9_9MICO|nr:hypothetical protein [Oryzihumus leptocrescens]TQL61213.1 hypothetical protein FB474_2620 [Oryzihumus leptocrescens]
MDAATFPQLTARDLDGREVALPAGLPGELTVVLVAFRRSHQALVDSWVPWLEARMAMDSRLRVVELPVLALHWAPGRAAIDGGMAAAIPDRAVRRRTLTVYTDVRRVTAALGIEDRETITVCLVDRSGRVWWKGSGGFDRASAAALEAAVPDDLEATGALPGVEQFGFDFDPRFRLVLAAVGATPTTSHVTVAPDRVLACLGPWSVSVHPHDVRDVSVTGPYHWYRGIGIRLSLADRGLTFGTTYARGVCLDLHAPVRGPLPLLRHPNLTLTVAEPERLAASVRRAAGLA